MESVYHLPALFATRVEVVWKLVGLRARKALLVIKVIKVIKVRREHKVFFTSGHWARRNPHLGGSGGLS
jgi:hypothetical protein